VIVVLFIVAEHLFVANQLMPACPCYRTLIYMPHGFLKVIEHIMFLFFHSAIFSVCLREGIWQKKWFINTGIRCRCDHATSGHLLSSGRVN